MVNNFANIAALGEAGINAFNFGNGDVTVNDNYVPDNGAGTVTSTDVSGEVYGIDALALSGGAGDVTVNLGANATLSTSTGSDGLFGIYALSEDTGNVTVSMTAGDQITSGSSGVLAVSQAAADSSASSITVTATGTINSGVNTENGGAPPAGIVAGYDPGDNQTPNAQVAGNVFVTSDATINAAIGFGIWAFNFGTGDTSVTTQSDSKITTSGTSSIDGFPTIGIGAYAYDGGNVSVDNAGSVTAPDGVAIGALATGGSHNGEITITNSGNLSGVGSFTIDPSTGLADPVVGIITDGGSSTVTNTDTGSIAAPSAAGLVLANIGGAVTVNNYGTITGDVALVNDDTFNNESGGVWNIAGSGSGNNSFGAGSAVNNAGTLNSSGASEINVTFDNTGTVNVDSGTLTFASTITNEGDGTGTFTIAANATLVFDSSVAAAETVNFANTAATLAIGDPGDFKATMSTLVVGDIIDLTSVASADIASVKIDTANSTIVVQENAAGNNAQLVFNYTGNLSSDQFTWTADNGGSGTGADLTLETATPPSAPTAVNGAITATEDTAYTFKVADFGFSDAVAADTLGSITITSLPSDGTLELNGVAITADGQVVTANELTAGDLTFVPTSGSTTAGSFQFQVTDSLGSTTSSNTATMEITITPPSAPTAVNGAITATEDTAYIFKVADFGFSDAVAADTLGSITITSLPSDGTLELNGVAITADGQVVTANELTAGDLTFVPTSGSTTAGSFQFQVTDSLGSTTSSNTATMEITITPPSAPTAVNGAITATEDTAYIFKVADFGFSDAVAADTLGSITITSLPSDGTLELNGVAITADGQVVTANELTAGDLTFVPTSGSTTAGSFQFQVTDSLGSTTSSNTATMEITITPPSAPTAVNGAITATEDTAYIFKVADFGFSDAVAADTLGSITITSLPSDGTLELNGVAITADGQVVTANELTAGDLTFVPTSGSTTAGSFQFQVTDSLGSTTSSNTATMEITITPPSAPTAVNGAITATEDTAYIFKVADFGFSDAVAADTLGSITITSLPSDGTLELNGVAITADGQVVTANELTAGDLTFVPTSGSTTAGSFQFQVTDSLGSTTSSNTATMEITITPPSAPTAVNGAITATEDTAYIFKVADFGFSDAVAADTLGSITITSLPSDGTLELNGVAITADGQVVTANELTAGDLTFVPTSGSTTAGSFQFQVTDSLGSTTSSNTATMEITITPPSAPTAVNGAITATEDTAYIFKVADFGFSDAVAADTLGSITITSLPSDGTLELNGVAITADGQVVTANELTAGDLTFVPTSGSTTAGSFQFQVTDSLGSTTSSNTATMEITITPPSAPTAVNGAITATEDTAYIFKVADFGFSDAVAADTLGSITITSLPSDGTLELNGVAITADGQVVTANELTAGDLTFVPTSGSTTAGSFQFQVTDSLGSTTSSNTATMEITITPPSAPTAVNGAITATEDTAYIFKVADFGFSDAVAADTLGSITITSLPSDGTLELNGVAITADGQVVTANELTAGDLTFVPTSGSTTAGSFQFQVTDSLGSTTSSNTATMEITITPPSAPTAVNGAITATEDTAYIFKVADFGFSDAVAADTLGSITITSLPSDGTLELNGVAITADGQVVTANELTAGDLTFVPTSGSTTAGSFQFQVTDSLGSTTSSNTATMEITITPPSAPTAVNGAITATEDTAYTFKVADFGFSDAVAADTLGSITITSLPSDGTLELNGVAITADGQVVTANELTAGDLTFVPTSGSTTAGSFQFQVTDSLGSTTSSNTATMEITITPPSAPTAVNGAITATEDTAYIFKVADFGFSDAVAADTLGSITITSLPSDGTLELNGVAITADGQVVTANELTAGDLTFVPTSGSTTAGSFQFQVTDSLGSTTSSNTATMEITITPPSAPTAVNGAITATEDTAYIFKVADFGFSDAVAADTLGSITITSLPSDGTLELNGVAITADGQVVTANELTAGDLTFVPTSGSTTAGSFQFQVTDSLGSTTSSNTATMEITITPVAPGTDHWLNGSGGDWSTASTVDWTFGSPPTSDNPAVIDASGSYVVTITTADAAASLTVNAAGVDVQDETDGSLTLDGALTIDTGTFSLGGNGRLSGETSIYVGGAIADFPGHLNAEGTVSAPVDNDGGIVEALGSLTLTGAVIGAGTFEINGNTLTFGSSVAGGTVDFGAPTGTLALGDVADFHAAISDFTGNDIIDLTAITYASGEHVVWDQTSADAGTLYVYGSSGISELEATFNLNGSYATDNFSLQSDSGTGAPGGTAGTEILWQANNNPTISPDSAETSTVDLFAPIAGGTFTNGGPQPGVTYSWTAASATQAVVPANYDFVIGNFTVTEGGGTIISDNFSSAPGTPNYTTNGSTFSAGGEITGTSAGPLFVENPFNPLVGQQAVLNEKSLLRSKLQRQRHLRSGHTDGGEPGLRDRADRRHPYSARHRNRVVGYIRRQRYPSHRSGRDQRPDRRHQCVGQHSAGRYQYDRRE